MAKTKLTPNRGASLTRDHIREIMQRLLNRYIRLYAGSPSVTIVLESFRADLEKSINAMPKRASKKAGGLGKR